LLCVAQYCVPNGVRVVSAARALGVAGSFALDARLGMATGCGQPVAFTPNSFHHLRYSGNVYLPQPGAEAIRLSDLRRAKKTVISLAFAVVKSH
jgi:hypothetical protein